MCKNIDKTQSKCKRPMGQKVILATISAFLLRAENCFGDLSRSSSPYSKALLGCEPKLLEVKTGPHNGNFTPKDNNDSLILGTVNYFKLDHSLGFIKFGETNQPGVTGSKKMGVLFYLSRSLKDCLAVHLSNQGVTVTYRDGDQEALRTYIEVDGEWVDDLFKRKAIEPLLHKDGCNKLVATSTPDFKILQACDYGIESAHGAEPIFSKSGIKLVEGAIDKTRLENKHHAGFIVPKDTPPSTSELVQLVRHICIGTVQSTDMICSASVFGNRLQPDTSASGEAPYFYIKNRNRYRLIPLGNNVSSVTDYGYLYRGSMSFVVEQADNVKQQKDPKEEVVVTDISNRLKKLLSWRSKPKIIYREKIIMEMMEIITPLLVTGMIVLIFLNPMIIVIVIQVGNGIHLV